MLRAFHRALRKCDGIGLSRRLSGIDFVLNSDEIPEVSHRRWLHLFDILSFF